MLNLRRLAPVVVLAAVLGATWGAAREATQSPPARFVAVDGEQLVGPDGAPLRLRGINLGNWLLPEGYMFKFQKGAQSPRQIEELVNDLIGPDAGAGFWREYRDAYITRDDIRFIRSIGLNSVRVPFNYRLLSPEHDPGTWREDGFTLLDRVIGWCREAGLLIVLDMHAAPGGQTGRNIDDSWGHPWLFESEESQARTVAIWRRLAERYRDEPAVLGYDLLNEPLPHEPAQYREYDARLEPLFRRIVAAIREVDPKHVIFLTGARWDTDFSVLGAPFAPGLAYTFHKYWNPTDDASIAPFLEFRARHRVPLWLGESGENTDEWVAACVRLMERHGIGWCFWPYKKLDATSSPVSVPAPEGWDEIVGYAAARTADFEANAKIRPSLQRSRAAFAGLVRNVRFDRVRVNDGYVAALRAR